MELYIHQVEFKYLKDANLCKKLRCPKELADKIAFETVNEGLKNYEEIEKVKFICFDEYNYKLYVDLVIIILKKGIKSLLNFISYFEDEKIKFKMEL